MGRPRKLRPPSPGILLLLETLHEAVEYEKIRPIDIWTEMRCVRCRLPKPFSDFPPRHDHRVLDSQCKACALAAVKGKYKSYEKMPWVNARRLQENAGLTNPMQASGFNATRKSGLSRLSTKSL